MYSGVLTDEDATMCDAAFKRVYGYNPKEDFIIRLEGETRSFRCDCGCNVFRRISSELRYRCNSCSATYTGE